MAEDEPKKPKFDNSLDAWSFRFGMVLVACMVLWLFFMIFLDASINFQCSVSQFFQGECNRFDRRFVPWDKLEKERGKTSFLRIDGYSDGEKVIAIRPTERPVHENHQFGHVTWNQRFSCGSA